ncbi:hypothetical protein LCGC14_2489930, partial [marine sediment metagenome]
TPLVESNPTDVNFSYQLNLTFLNQSVYQNNTFGEVHQVSPISLANCSVQSATQNVTLNFTYRQENDRVFFADDNKSGTFKATFVRYIDDVSVNKTTSFDFTNVTTVGICLTPVDTSITTDAQIEYNSDDFDVRNYYFEQARLDANTQQIELNLLESSLATGIIITVQDENGIPLPLYVLNIQRYDVGADTYTTAAMGRTDNDGDDTVFLRGGSASTADAWYRFIITNRSSVVFIDATARKITTPALEFTISPDTLGDILKDFRGIQHSLIFNNVTKAFVLTYVDPSGNVGESCLEVIKNTVSGSSQVCEKCETTSSATITCEIDNSTGVYIAMFTSSINPGNIIAQLIITFDEGVQKLYTILGGDSYIITLFIVGMLSLAFAFSPSTQIFGIIIGLAIASMLTILNMGFGILLIVFLMFGWLMAKMRS